MDGNSGQEAGKRLCVGLLAHVDAGKTTLSEGMLYLGGAIRRLGRVDHQDAFLDTDEIERERGITIFSKQAILRVEDVEFTLLDTPGHVDFSTEMERTLQVLDCAVLVISGADGVQGHTQTLWRLLRRYQIPTFLFVNKMDQPGTDRDALLGELKQRLSEGCLDLSLPEADLWEQAALCDESALERYLERGSLTREELADLVWRRKVFPCLFGSALKLEGVEELLTALARLSPEIRRPAQFGARVFKITRDAQGSRLTWMKITGGTLRVKMPLAGGEGEETWEEKAEQIRVYSGEKYRAVDRAEAGSVCAVTGLTRTRPGQGLGAESDSPEPALEPLLTYTVRVRDGTDPHTALQKLSQLEEEDPLLRLEWNARMQAIQLQLMGQVQLEVLRRVIRERFALEVEFESGGVSYRETIAEPVIGIGHYEPLRHYAEVHLLLEPLPPGSGVQAVSACSTDILDLNWQRLVLSHLLERRYPGVLIGAPLTDVRITLLTGRAHLKHTEGGDFRQATVRALRQGLMQAQPVLLEPWYDFRLEVPGECLGRAMADIQRMQGTFDPPDGLSDPAVLTGTVPVAALGEYQTEVASYTRGRGKLSCTLKGYFPCHNQEEIAAASGYDPERDPDNPPDSVFCEHGGGRTVKWDRVREFAHVDSGLRLGTEEEERRDAAAPAPRRSYSGMAAEDRELQAIFERTYGRVDRRAFEPQRKPARTQLADSYDIRERPAGKDYLLVDGYNIIFAWEELREIARTDVTAAREALADILSNYQGFHQCEVILVYDAYRVRGNPGSVERRNSIYVVYTREAETADNYIEKATLEIGKKHRVRVATSDYLEQIIILGHGATRVSARAFHEEIEQTQGRIRSLISRYNRGSEGLGKVGDTAVVSRKD